MSEPSPKIDVPTEALPPSSPFPKFDRLRREREEEAARAASSSATPEPFDDGRTNAPR